MKKNLLICMLLGVLAHLLQSCNDDIGSLYLSGGTGFHAYIRFVVDSTGEDRTISFRDSLAAKYGTGIEEWGYTSNHEIPSSDLKVRYVKSYEGKEVRDYELNFDHCHLIGAKGFDDAEAVPDDNPDSDLYKNLTRLRDGYYLRISWSDDLTEQDWREDRRTWEYDDVQTCYITSPLIFKDNEEHSFSYYIHVNGRDVDFLRFEIDGKAIPFDDEDFIPAKSPQKDGSVKITPGCSWVTWHLPM